MTFEIGDGFEKLAEWILAIPGKVPILLGADPHNASAVRALGALILIAFVIYVIAKRPLRSVLTYLKNSGSNPDKPN